MQKDFLEIGKIINVHALKGEVKVMPWCDSADFLCEFDILYMGKEKKPIEIQNARVFKNMVIMKFSGIDTVEDASLLKNAVLYMNREDVELEEGTYFIQDLIGLSVYDADTNMCYGKIKDVIQTGANDVYTISDGSKEYLIPAIPDVVIETDVENETMKIRPLRGLFDDED
jgi:16S rRNA processing protein RimM